MSLLNVFKTCFWTSVGKFWQNFCDDASWYSACYYILNSKWCVNIVPTRSLVYCVPWGYLPVKRFSPESFFKLTYNLFLLKIIIETYNTLDVPIAAAANGIPFVKLSTSTGRVPLSRLLLCRLVFLLLILLVLVGLLVLRAGWLLGAAVELRAILSRSCGENNV